MRLDVTASRELLATIYAVRALDKTIQKMIRQHTKRIAAPEWSKALARRANSQLEHRVLVDTSTVAVSNQNVKAQSANKGRPMSGGLAPKLDWAAVEFGADTSKVTSYQGRRGGKRFPVTRHTARQLKPRNHPRGYVFYPAADEMVPRLAALFVQTVVRTIATAFEGKQE